MIGLLSSDCPESQREAALLLGQFATTEPEFKIKIVQRGAVAPLIQMLNNNATTRAAKMAAFALGRLAQNTGQSGWHLPRIWPATAVGPAGLERRQFATQRGFRAVRTGGPRR